MAEMTTRKLPVIGFMFLYSLLFSFSCHAKIVSDYERNGDLTLPVVVNTWGISGSFIGATNVAYEKLSETGSNLDAIVAGCSHCEQFQCDGTVGFGGSPDETGETTLDAMIMDGANHDVGSVACLRNVKNAIGVARSVMEHTKHTLLVGELARDFAIEMGFEDTSLQTNHSRELWENWKENNCQPNYRQNVSPDPSTSCGPYKPATATKDQSTRSKHGAHINSVRSRLNLTEDQTEEKHWVRYNADIREGNHDTIGMIVVDQLGNLAGGTSTNGARNKVPGRVGDSPITGAGAYVEKDIGGAAATGDGDVMMRFLPSYHAVQLMGQGLSPNEACEQAIAKIVKFYPNFSGALVAVTAQGEFGAGCHGLGNWPYSVRTQTMQVAQEYRVQCS